MKTVAVCYTKREAEDCERTSTDVIWFNRTCYNATDIADHDSDTSCLSVTTTSVTDSSLNCTPFNWLLHQISQRTSATEEYFMWVLENILIFKCELKNYLHCSSVIRYLRKQANGLFSRLYSIVSGTKFRILLR